MSDFNVAIISLGLMGSSLGLALKEKRPGVKVFGYTRREETAHAALQLGVCDAAFTDIGRAVRDAALVVYCAPVGKIPALVRESKPHLRPGALLTDVGSTKVTLTEEIGGILAGSERRFIGSHPIAGSERSGLGAARPDLYEGATIVLTPDPVKTEDKQVAFLADFWRSVGGRPVILEAAEHDRLLARTSHLPHITAALLVQTVARDGLAIAPFVGSGFRDTTRIASGSAAMWRDIIVANRDCLLTELAALRGNIDEFIRLLQNEDWPAITALLERSRQDRESLVADGNHT